MHAHQLSHYEVLERVGSGGMGQVFRARDTRLKRDVALKLLSPDLGPDSGARKRLVSEARAASRLDHPNVCTVYEIDESADGTLFIAMAYCPGRTLEQRLHDGDFSIGEVASIARQIAEGLAAAHDSGVVHRDVKPGNVIITEEGRVKIVDFGVAKLADSHLTRESTTAGTTAYMAPEQIRGDDIDARADVWAFGVLCYQMLTSRLPFQAQYDQAVMYRILHAEPDPLDPDLPAELAGLARIVESCLQKDPELRPSIREIAEWLGADVQPQPVRARPARLPRGLAGPAWSRRRVVVVSAVAFSLALAGILFFAATPSIPSEKYLVVLPLSAIGGTEEDQQLADGLTATLTNKLAQLAAYTDEPYWVVPHSEVLTRVVTSPSTAQRAFGATLALEGSVVRHSGGLRLTLSLIEPRRMRTLRAMDIDLADGEIGRIQDEAAHRLAGMMNVQLHADVQDVLLVGRTDDPEAYDLYLRARAYLDRFDRKENLETAASLLRRALGHDPRFGRAHAALGEANWRLYETTRDEIYLPLAQRSLEQALAIDERLPSAHLSLARVYAGGGRPMEALRSVSAVLTQEPRNAEAYIALGWIQNQAGRFEEAEQAFHEAIRLRPAYWDAHNQLGVFFYRRGRYEEAEAAWRQVTLLTPDNARAFSNLGAVYHAMDRLDSAAASLERSIELHPTYEALANLATFYYVELEDMERAVHTYDRALEIEDGDYRPWYYLALGHGHLGQEEEARHAKSQAIRRAERHLQLNPSDQRAMVELATMYIRTGERARARELLTELSDRPIDDVEVLSLVADAYELVGDRVAALEWLCRAFATGYAPERAERMRGLAEVREDPRFADALACAGSH